MGAFTVAQVAVFGGFVWSHFERYSINLELFNTVLQSKKSIVVAKIVNKFYFQTSKFCLVFNKVSQI